MKKYIKPSFIVIDIKEPICGHYDSQGRWDWWGRQFVNEYFQEETSEEKLYNVFEDSLSNNSDFLKFNNKVWADQW